MRTLAINRQPMWYALYEGKEEVLDEYGNHTGVFELKYSDPVYFPVNMSESRNVVNLEEFGITTDYDRTFVTTDLSCPITEDTIIWFGVDPQTAPHNYVVHRVANSLNSITYAIREVDVS